MVDIKEGISDVNQFKWLALYDTFKPIIAMYFADGAEKPLDNFIETVTMNKSLVSSEWFFALSINFRTCIPVDRSI